MPTTSPPPSCTVYRLRRDGDLLVFDPAFPGEGFVQFYSVERGELRKFVRSAVRPQLERVADTNTHRDALAAYAVWRVAQPVPETQLRAPRAVASATAPRQVRRPDARTPMVNAHMAGLLDQVTRRPGGVLFVTGRAGTGKSTILRELATHFEGRSVVLAPTGLAALNAGGQTIHSFFRFPLKAMSDQDVRRGPWMSIARKLDVLIVDEVSMVRADLLDTMSVALQEARESRSAFGGVTVVLFGDPYQLPPIVGRDQEEAFAALGYRSPHFFDARVLSTSRLRTFELTTVYRQRDPHWIALLDRVRTGPLTASDGRDLQACVKPVNTGELDETIVLTAYRKTADQLNEQRLRALDDHPTTFAAERSGVFLRDGWDRLEPAPDPLILKRGARVMFVKNDPEQAWVNGSLGDVEEIRGTTVRVRLDTGVRVTVTPQEWVQQEYWVDDEGEVCTRPVGRFRQLPLQLAWAVTIHKSQGLTFDRVHVDLGRGAFSPGQVYVALSRCRTRDGLTLQRALTRQDVIVDERVSTFFATP